MNVTVTEEGHFISSDRQQVVHEQQEDCVTQDQRHLEG